MSPADSKTILEVSLPRVLIVDDDPEILKMLRAVLRNHHVQVVTASTAEELHELVKKDHYHLMVCDLNLSYEGEGTDLLKAFNEAQPHAVSILMSGQLDTDSIVSAINDSGIWKCISKPIGVKEISTLITNGIQEANRRNPVPVAVRHDPANGQHDTIIVNPNVDADEYRMPLRQSPPRPEPLETAFILDEGRYRVHSLIGEGGLGSVYLAEDTLLQVPVAIKYLREEVMSDPFLTDLFLDEARLTMKLSHPHIVRLYALHQANQRMFMVMEYIEGYAMHDVIHTQGPLSKEIVCGIAQACGSALQLAHDHGISHCDIKPENLLLSRAGTPKLIDFGLARLMQHNKFKKFIAGTTEYMSPEQARGDELHPASDQFSFAVVLYEMLTGGLPAESDSKHTGDTPYHPLTDITPDERTVLERALQKDPASRWPSMREFTQAFLNACSLT